MDTQRYSIMSSLLLAMKLYERLSFTKVKEIEGRLQLCDFLDLYACRETSSE